MNAAIPEHRRDQGSRGRYNRRMQPYVPFLTWRFGVALQFASGLHYKQARKVVSIPYVAHLMGVCALVLEAGGDEDQAIAALLHDAVEDQGGLTTLETIRHSVSALRLRSSPARTAPSAIPVRSRYGARERRNISRTCAARTRTR